MHADVREEVSALRNLSAIESAASQASNFDQYDNEVAAEDAAATRWTDAAAVVEHDLGL